MFKAIILAFALSSVVLNIQWAGYGQSSSEFPPDLRAPLTLPIAPIEFRGLLAQVDAQFRVSFGEAKVRRVEMIGLVVDTPYDPLPDFLALPESIERWGSTSLANLKTSTIDDFSIEVELEFRIDFSLSKNQVKYLVEYEEEESKNGVSQPSRIVVIAPPADTDRWKDILKEVREHESQMGWKKNREREPN